MISLNIQKYSKINIEEYVITNKENKFNDELD